MLEKRNHRNSHQRKVILEELRKVKSHPSAGLLFEIVRKKIPNISLGTVYRNLEFLSKKGIIQKLGVAGKETRFDGDTEKHYHISCTICGRIDDINELRYENKSIKKENMINGFQVSGYQINYFGICPDCQNGPDSRDSGNN